MTHGMAGHSHDNLLKLVSDDRVLSGHVAADATFADLAQFLAIPEIGRHGHPRSISVTLGDHDTR